MHNGVTSAGGGPGRRDDDRGLHRLPARVAALILLSALGALLTAAVLETQAGATAYIIGESHWSKAQQRAVHSLYRYASHAQPADLADARAALRCAFPSATATAGVRWSAIRSTSRRRAPASCRAATHRTTSGG